MKKLIITLLAALPLTFGAMAQEYPKASIKALYDYHRLGRHTEGYDITYNEDMVLLASNDASRFYGCDVELYDSLNSTPEGKEKYRQMLKELAPKALIITNGSISVDRSKVNLPSRVMTFQVIKEPGSSVLKVLGSAAQEDYEYPVEMSDLAWEIADSTTTILGYECLMATADYHGRKWTAWFAPDIPVPAGPWQLMGLPGLIMDASSEGGEYGFTIKGIEQTDQPITPRPGKHEYIKTTRKDYLKFKHEIKMNPEKAFPDGKVKIVNKAESRKAQEAHDLIETDYR